MAGKTLNSYARSKSEVPMPEIDSGTWETSGESPMEQAVQMFSQPIEFDPQELDQEQQAPQQFMPQEQQQFEAQEPEQQEEPEQVVVKPLRQQKSAAENLREIREAKERAERERDELMRMYQMQQMQQQMQQQQQVKMPEPEPIYEMPDLDLDDDGLAENKHIKLMHKQMQAMQKQIQMQKQEAIRIQQQTQESMIETRIRATYPDFDKVVSNDNLALLGQMYPSMARTINSSPDLFDKAVSAYTLIKQFGISKDMTPNQDAARAINNINKPRPLSSISPSRGQTSNSPLTRVNGFANANTTAERRKSAYEEMIEAARNY
jgi:hypothetical protein